MAGTIALPLAYQSLGFSNEDIFRKQFGYTGSGAWSGFNNQTDRDKYNTAYQNTVIPRVNFLQSQQTANPEAYNEWAANPSAFQGNNPFKSRAQLSAEQAAKMAIVNTSKSTSNPSAQQQHTSSGVNPIVPRVTAHDLPSFLPANNEKQISELKNLLATLPGYFDTKALEAAYDQQVQFGTSMGQQTAGNAAREFINRQSLQGGDRSLGGLVRAQAMLPVMQQNADITQKKEGVKLDASTALAKITGDVANNIASLRNNYLATLASYTSNLQQMSTGATLDQNKLAEQSRQFGLNFNLDQQKLDLQRQLGMTEAGQNQQSINQKQLALLAQLGLLGNNQQRNGQRRPTIDYTNSGVPGLPWNGNYI